MSNRKDVPIPLLWRLVGRRLARRRMTGRMRAYADGYQQGRKDERAALTLEQAMWGEPSIYH